MATFSMSFTVLAILAKEYPNGLTRRQLLEKANAIDPSRFANHLGMVDMVLGVGKHGERVHGLVACWKKGKGNKIYYDLSRKSYAPSLELISFSDVFNDWLRKNNLEHLILFERISPKNSERCALGLDWGSVPFPNWCSWNYEQEECSMDCRATKSQFEAKVMRIEQRNYKTYFKRQLDGD